MIAQNEINVLGELANKTDNRTVWQVYVTSELKIKLCFVSGNPFINKALFT